MTSYKFSMAENRFQKEQYWKVIIFSVIGATIMTYFSCSSCSQDLGKFLLTAFFSSVMWSIMWIGNSELTHYLSTKISWVDFPVRRFFVGITSTVVFTVLVAIGLLKSWEYSWNIKFNSYNEFIIISLVITFLISLFMHGREFLLRWKQSAVEAERYQKESMTATYESLKSQVNPHFLFNSLNALTNLVYEDQDKAVKFIKQLSEVYRYVLDTRNNEVVPLAEELKFLNSYIFLQQIRFGDKLSIDVQLNGLTSMVAPLAIQMLIENAVKHNEVSEENPLHIKIYMEESFIAIENNLQPKSLLGESSSGMGLDNIAKRYEFLSNQKVGVSQDNGIFKVKLPIISQS
jgi:sensor histidine kinase YesM